MLIDTHCHIHDRDTYKFAHSKQQISEKFLKKYPDYPHELADFTTEKIVERARKTGVEQMITVGTSHQDSLTAIEVAGQYKGVFCAYGIHPDEVDKNRGDNTARELRKARKLVAIGEVGLDYHHGSKNREKQIKLLEEMLQLARDLDLPLIFHVREAFSDFFSVISNFPGITGVVHSFSDSPENLNKALEQGFYIGVNGLATFSEIPLPPLEKTLLETDAPFLTPRPFRGTINEPAHIREICAYVAQALNQPESEIAGRTTKNARQLFRLPE